MAERTSGRPDMSVSHTLATNWDVTGTGHENCKKSGRISLTELPDDVLFLILDCCDIQSLSRLCQVCRKLKVLVQTDSVWLKYSRQSFLIGSTDSQNHR